MSLTMTIEVPVTFTQQGRDSHQKSRLEAGSGSLPAGRVPWVARLMALALRLDELVRTGQVPSCSALASLGHVTRARISQIMNLLNLAPDILEAVLFLPRIERGRAPIQLRHLQPIASTFDWGKQRRQWRELCRQQGVSAQN